MKISVDENLCIGCGACVNTCPQSFKMNQEKHKSEPINPPGDPEEKIKEAKDNCPAGAIKIEE
ncbi:MAG: ferredoxin [Candidatus Berkelbacteria bacterium]|nr:ferredoxin [Candidatus Berkelbacteria bacterium]